MRMAPTKLGMMRMTNDGMGRVGRIFGGVRGSCVARSELLVKKIERNVVEREMY